MEPSRAIAEREGVRVGHIALWVFLAFSVVYIGLARGHFIGTDEIGLYQTTRSLWVDHDLHVGPIFNTFEGRGGQVYSQYSVGQSVAALPLYGIGSFVRTALEGAGLDSWERTLGGPVIGEEPSRWGGDIEMFFVALFNVFVTAGVCALFFVFSMRLGGSVGGSLISTALLGLTTYVAPFITTFLQHPSEALFVLWSCYFLVSDARCPRSSSRAWAGTMLALAFVFRFQSVIAMPALGLYLGCSVWSRRRPSTWIAESRAALVECSVFVLPIMCGAAVHFGANWAKFGTIAGHYTDTQFGNPFPTGLPGLLISPGDSVFLYSPLLLLLPWTLSAFVRRWRAETLLIVAIAASYVLFYASFIFWHGLWSDMGPRYLMPTVPVLMLPLTGWMDARGRRAWLAVAPLAIAGAWVQFIHVAANFSFVAYYEDYITSWPPDLGFLFTPSRSPILAHSRAVLAWDYRVDMWLNNVYRLVGPGRLLTLLMPLLGLLAACVWRLRVAVARESTRVGLWTPDVAPFPTSARAAGEFWNTDRVGP